MGGARGLFASLGASISFVADAALSLLVVTFGFANHVSSGAVQAPPSHAVFVDEESPAAPDARSRGSDAVVVGAARAPASKPAARVVQRRSESHALRAQAAEPRIVRRPRRERPRTGRPPERRDPGCDRVPS